MKKEKEMLMKFEVSYSLARGPSMCTASWQVKHDLGDMMVAGCLRGGVPPGKFGLRPSCPHLVLTGTPQVPPALKSLP